MTILHPFDPRTQDTPRQAGTWAALEAMPLGGYVEQIRHVAVGHDTRYEDAVRRAWVEGPDLCVVEQDVVPRPVHLRALARCPEPVCAWPYLLYGWPGRAASMDGFWTLFATLPSAEQDRLWALPSVASSRILYDLADDVPVLSAQVRLPVFEGTLRFVTADDEYADHTGLGLTRFRASFLRACPPWWAAGPWWDLDARIGRYLRAHGVRVHLHWSAALPAHHHGCPCHPETAGPSDPHVAAAR